MTMMKMCSRKCPASGPMEASKGYGSIWMRAARPRQRVDGRVALKNAHDVASTAERLQARKIKNCTAFFAHAGEENRRLRGL
jgi:hypothetical protein